MGAFHLSPAMRLLTDLFNSDEPLVIHPPALRWPVSNLAAADNDTVISTALEIFQQQQAMPSLPGHEDGAAGQQAGRAMLRICQVPKGAVGGWACCPEPSSTLLP